MKISIEPLRKWLITTVANATLIEEKEEHNILPQEVVCLCKANY